jgi:hypothetical protein
MVTNQIERSEMIQKLKPQQETVFKEGFSDSNVSFSLSRKRELSGSFTPDI